jgi:hypothetical protein
MKKIALLSSTALISTFGSVFGTIQTVSALSWQWNYSGTGITANGTFTTNDTPDSSGFYQITGITGQRNGDTINGLQTAGTAIPGNEPYAVDNLISLGSQQLTGNGFGYSTSGGNYSNLFFADFLTTPGYLDFNSVPPFTGVGSTESNINFSATVVPFDIPGGATIPALGSVLALSVMRKARKFIFVTAKVN